MLPTTIYSHQENHHKSFTQCQFNDLFQHSWDASQFQPKCCFEISKFIIVECTYSQKKPMCEGLHKNEK
jgi:CDGSH-type Zn-finger protein